MIILVMGVTGSGKTTLAKALADRLGWPFREGDDLHPPANIEKMKAAIPLSDADRIPWLDNVKAWIGARLSSAVSGVITCSALKRAYRDHLGLRRIGIRLVYVRGETPIIAERLAGRQAHFMPASLLASQLAILQPPLPDENPIILDARMTTQEQVAAIIQHLNPQPD